VYLFRYRGSSKLLLIHVLTHIWDSSALLSFHKHCVQQHRPFPRFLFLDQPSQGYYPQDIELDPSMDTTNDEERQAVLRMFNLIFGVVEDLAPHFQVVITEHANLDDARYQSYVRENWRGGHALVPTDWVSRESR